MLLLSGCSIERFLPDIDQPVDTGSGDDVDASADALDDVADGDDVSDVPRRDTGTSDTSSDAGEDAFFDPDIEPSFDLPPPTDPPILDAVYPDRGSAEGGELVVVEGANFSLDMEVRIGGVLQTRIDIIDEYAFAFVTEASDAGTYELKVSTPAGVAAWPPGFTFIDPLQVLSVNPEVARSGAVTEVSVTGAGFSRNTRFVVGDREATVTRFGSATTVDLLVAPNAPGTLADVWAFDASSRAVLREAIRFEASPQLRALVPQMGSTTGGDVVRIDGAGIDDSCVATFGTVTRPVVVGDAGWPEVETPGGNAGTVDVSIDCGPRGSTFVADAFQYIAPGSFVVGAVWPNQTFTRGGDIVTISGAGLSDVRRVRFNGVISTIIGRSEHAVEVLAPAHPVALVDVTVEIVSEARVLPDAFRYIEQPVFLDVSPATGPARAEFNATLSGVGLATVDAVLLDGEELAPVSRSSNRVSFVVPAAAAGRSDLGVRIGAIAIDTGLDIERVAELRFDGFQPRDGAASGGTVVYVTGSGFSSGCVVRFDGVEAPTDVRGGSLLAAITPPHEPGNAVVTVTGCGDYAFPATFRYVDPTRLPGGVGGGELDGELRVSVREFQSNAPIVGATVQVQVRAGTPYVGLTDEDGQITFVGEDLVGEQTITAYAPERSAESYINTGARDVTLMLNPLPPPPCEPGDPECEPPPPPPLGEIVGFLTGLRKVVDPPPGTVIAAKLETTRQAQGYVNPDSGVDGTRFEEGPFRITTRLGDVALIALCGYQYVEAVDGHQIGEFVPLTMGVVRGISQREGEPFRTAIDCNIDLSESLVIKIPGAPGLDAPVDDYTYPGSYRARVHFDFGGEGFFESLPLVRSQEAIFTASGYPPLGGPLAGVRFDVTAGAYPRAGNIPSSESYARRVGDYERVLVMPALLPVPTFTVPTAENPRLTDGYVEWSMPADSPVPSFYSVSLSSSNSQFPRWSIFVPGSQNSFHLTDFAVFSDVYGELPTPGDPAGTFSIYIRAIAMDVFSFDDFDRYALRSRGWRAVATTYRNISLATGPAPETPPETPPE
jgi:hypothetical protein